MSDLSQPVGPATPPSQPYKLPPVSLSQDDIKANRVIGEIDAFLNSTSVDATHLNGSTSMATDAQTFATRLSSHLGNLEGSFQFTDQSPQNASFQSLIGAFHAFQNQVDAAGRGEVGNTQHTWDKIKILNNEWKESFKSFKSLSDQEAIQANRFIGEIDAILNDTVGGDAKKIDLQTWAGLFAFGDKAKATSLDNYMNSQITNLEHSFSFSPADNENYAENYKTVMGAMHDFWETVKLVEKGWANQPIGDKLRAISEANEEWKKSFS